MALHGFNNFSLTILVEIGSNTVFLDDKLNEAENYFFGVYECEYNILKYARNSLGYIHSDNAKKLISLSRTGATHSLSTREKMSIDRTGANNNNFGKKASDSTRAKMRLIALNRTKSHKLGTILLLTDITTNVIFQYSSIREAAKAIPCNHGSLLRYEQKCLLSVFCFFLIKKTINKPVKAFKNRYLIKFIKP